MVRVQNVFKEKGFKAWEFYVSSRYLFYFCYLFILHFLISFWSSFVVVVVVVLPKTFYHQLYGLLDFEKTSLDGKEFIFDCRNLDSFVSVKPDFRCIILISVFSLCDSRSLETSHLTPHGLVLQYRENYFNSEQMLNRAVGGAWMIVKLYFVLCCIRTWCCFCMVLGQAF